MNRLSKRCKLYGNLAPVVLIRCLPHPRPVMQGHTSLDTQKMRDETRERSASKVKSHEYYHPSSINSGLNEQSKLSHEPQFQLYHSVSTDTPPPPTLNMLYFQKNKRFETKITAISIVTTKPIRTRNFGFLKISWSSYLDSSLEIVH